MTSPTLSSPRPSKRQLKEAARAARLAAERARAEREQRRRRILVLGVATVLVVAAVAVLVLAGGRDTTAEPAGATPQGVADVSGMLSGIPQDGVALGDPKAAVTLVEFADLQCPFCRDFAQQTFPLIVRDYVRTGKVRIEFATLKFIGPDSERAGRLAAGAAAQDRLWHFTDLFYFNQGEENSGYATDAFLERLLANIPGLDAARARQDAGSPAADRLLADAQALASRHGVDSTPALLIGRTGSEQRRPIEDVLNYQAVRAAIDAALAR